MLVPIIIAAEIGFWVLLAAGTVEDDVEDGRMLGARRVSYAAALTAAILALRPKNRGL